MRTFMACLLLLLAAGSARAASGDEIALGARMKNWMAATEPRTNALRSLAAPEAARIVEALKGTLAALPDGTLIQYRVPVAASNQAGKVTFRAWALEDDRELMRAHDLMGFQTRIAQASPDGRMGVNEDWSIAVFGPGPYRQGEPLRGVGRADGIFEYTTVANEQRRIPKYQMLENRSLNLDELAALCKAGRKFKALTTVRLTCPYCGGIGNVRGPNRMDRLPCDPCQSSGKMDSPAPVILVW